MKEKYMKPCLVAECFKLTQSIASDCGDPHRGKGELFGHTAQDSSNCSFGMGDGIFVFSSSVPSCDMEMDPAMLEFYCYNNPASGFSVFGS